MLGLPVHRLRIRLQDEQRHPGFGLVPMTVCQGAPATRPARNPARFQDDSSAAWAAGATTSPTRSRAGTTESCR